MASSSSALPSTASAFVIEEPIDSGVHAYPYTEQNCDLRHLQRIVGGHVETVPAATNASFIRPKHIPSNVKTAAKSLTAYVKEDGFMANRNDSGERLLMALGFHVNLLFGLRGSIVITQGKKQPSSRLVQMLQGGFQAASIWDDDEDDDEDDHGQDPDIKKIRSAMDASLEDEYRQKRSISCVTTSDEETNAKRSK